MKVIDLLNKIANGEEVPKKIKINGLYLTYNEKHTFHLQSYYIKDIDNNETWCIWAYRLNDEVEIIEEDKKIEKIEYIVDEDGSLFIDGFDDEKEQKLQIAKKVNEIIDYLEEKEWK